jgi:uncharacterized protein GlcG (DUF336 family)
MHLRKRMLGALALIVASVTSQADSTFSLTSLTPDVALKLATAARQSCNEQGYQVAVAVVDRSGLLQAFIRDRFATPHTVEVAERKAWTALSFRIPTSEMEEATNHETNMMGIRHASQALMVGGGLPIEAGGSLLGGIGISGAPGGDLDEACAADGLLTIEDDLLF